MPFDGVLIVLGGILLLAMFIAGAIMINKWFFGWVIDEYAKKINTPKVDNLQAQVDNLKRRLDDLEKKK